jgi:hypothetical protein
MDLSARHALRIDGGAAQFMGSICGRAMLDRCITVMGAIWDGCGSVQRSKIFSPCAR